MSINLMMKKTNKKVNPYLAQKIMTASPEQLILYIYDASISACGRKDRRKAAEAIQELVNSLNFKEKKVATTFYNMYQYILNLIHNQKFEEAQTLLRDIRNTWAEAMKLN
ncbi:MAG: flagellar protein FliS [Candidatus Marinimicrobia bacterium]|nr:flagellar protein FliS [Candidatus Neomarinimicrobiota bacterium]